MQVIGDKYSRLKRSMGHKYSNSMQIVGMRNNPNLNQVTHQPVADVKSEEINSAPSASEIKYMPTGLNIYKPKKSYNSLERK
jgi:hypothetical protein